MRPKICLVSSPGGHLFHLIKLKKWWSKYPHFWISKNSIDSKTMIGNKEEIYYANFPEQRNIINFIKNLVLAIKIIYREKPDIIISSGAGIAPPFFLVGKLLGSKLIFVEIYDFIKYPTLSGKMIYPFADLFIVQHKQQLKSYPNAVMVGNIL